MCYNIKRTTKNEIAAATYTMISTKNFLDFYAGKSFTIYTEIIIDEMVPDQETQVHCCAAQVASVTDMSVCVYACVGVVLVYVGMCLFVCV